MAEEKMSTLWKKLGYGCLFGISWICGTAIGWGLLNNITVTFLAIGVFPFLSAIGVAWFEFTIEAK